MKILVILCFLLLLSQSVFSSQATYTNSACAAVLCLYGEAEGVEASEECKLALENYYSINQNSERNSCEETKRLRKQFLNSCKENVQPVDDLVNCLF